MNARWVRPAEFGRVFPRGADIIILPGSRRTVADLDYLRQSGGERILRDHLGAGGTVVGICGGLQILGNKLHDPLRRQGYAQEADGLGLLPINTLFGPKLVSTKTEARCRLAWGDNIVRGEEHRSGFSWADSDTTGFIPLNEVITRVVTNEPAEPNEALLPGVVWNPCTEPNDGFVSTDRRIWGTYIHLIFHNEAFCKALFACV